MYQEQAASGDGGTATDGNEGDSTADEDVIEGEFSEE
jgi:hypothetical protein